MNETDEKSYVNIYTYKASQGKFLEQHHLQLHSFY